MAVRKRENRLSILVLIKNDYYATIITYNMNWPQIIPLLLGIVGGAIGAYFQSLFQHKKQMKENEYAVKRQRYFCINLLLLAKVDLPNNLQFLLAQRSDLTTEELLDKEIEVEYFNSFIFASDKVILGLQKFINSPSYDTYYFVCNAMRNDLWGNKILLPEIKMNRATIER
ncbi:hypothetical protein [Chitinophaga sp. CF418]|uniref:hypothetical protein n=1 Tax=Chitinophaga sp. CF418 TaxID=1855287 RepID=UPI00122C5F42|nr:hypothetical protein [Chitinophaga sp. CF418]